MANVDIREGYKDAAWFTANPTLVLKQGQRVNLLQTGTYKLGDGVTSLSALSFLGGGDTVDVNTIGAAINGAASATPNDTDLVMSVDTSVAKKNTWTQVKAFLKTYFDTVYTTTASVATQITTALSSYVKKGTLTTNYIPKATSSDTIGDSNIIDDGTNVGIGLISPTSKVHIHGADSTSGNYALKVDNSFSPLLYVRNDGYVNIGLGNTTFGTLIGAPSFAAMYMNVTTNTNNYVLASNGTTLIVNGPSEILYAINNSTKATMDVNKFNVLQPMSVGSIIPSGTQQFAVGGLTYIQGTDSTSSNYALKVDNSASSPLLYVRNDGNVGISTASPIAKLDVNGSIRSENLTASQILETDASKNLVSVAKGTAYNKNFGTTAGTVLEGDRITQVITNGVTDKVPSEDAVFDALITKAPLASPALTGNPTAPTQTAGDNSTKIATTEYIDRKTLFKTTSDSSTHTGTLTNTIVFSEDISNKLSSGDIAEIVSDVVRVSGSTSATIRYYLNSSNSLSGATQIGQYFYGFSGLNIADFRRQLIVKSSTSIRIKGAVSSFLNDYAIFSTYTDVTVNLGTLWIIFAITLGNTGDQFLVSSRKMVK